KYNSSGSLLWNHTSSFVGVGNGLALDDSGNIYITGYMENKSRLWGDVFLLKYHSYYELIYFQN
ncbi:unnamed protein product, partial [marine sediment metagenome]